MTIAQTLEAPRGGVPSLSELFQPDTMLPAGLTIVGDVLWMVAYIAAIVIGFRRRTYGLPILAVCLNITWEFVYTVIHTPGSGLTLGLHLAWLTIDLVILYQIFRFGRSSVQNLDLRRYYVLVLVGTLGLCTAFHLTWHAAQTSMAIFPDTLGVTSAFIINLIMSVMFVSLCLRRPDHPGLSLKVAWTKFVGTTLISIANTIGYFRSTSEAFHVQVRNVNSDEWVYVGTIGAANFDPAFMFFLFASIFLFDIIYIWLLSRRRIAESTAASA